MARAYTNFAKSTLSVGLNPADVSITVASGDGALFPAAGAGTTFDCVIFNTAGLKEVVVCTARTGDVLTVTRAAEGTAALTWNAGDRIGHRLTAAALNNILFADDVQENTPVWCGTAGGTANALTLTPTPALTAYAVGASFLFTAASDSTTAATVAISGLAAIALQSNYAALVGGEIQTGKVYRVTLNTLTTAQIRPESGLIDVNKFTTKGDILVATAAGVVTRVGVGANSTVFTADSAQSSGVRWATLDGAFVTMINGKIEHSRAGNAETIAIKTKAGADPSASDPVLLVFRSATVTDGGYEVLTLTAATSLTITSGSTLGASSGVAFRLWIVGFNDGGTFRLGVINCRTTASIYPLAPWNIASSTAEGGAGGADSAQVFYTGAAVTSKAYVVLGYSEFGLATAGTWNTAPSRTQLFGLGVPLPGQPTGNRVFGTNGGGSSTTSTSYVDVSQSNVTITPRSACNIVEVAWSFSAQHINAVGVNNTLNRQALRDASVIAGPYATVYASGSGGGSNYTHGAIGPLVDAPATTSAVTYKLQHKTDSGSATVVTANVNVVAQELMG
jgi:hypothetical protein